MDRLAFLDEIRVLAENGLKYAQNEYDERRYGRLLELATSGYGEVLGLPTEEVARRFAEELGHVTPKIGADGALFDEAGRILLMLRADEGTWCLPCGWIEPNETPWEAAAREVLEETGLAVEVTDLVGLFPRTAGPDAGPHGVVSVLYLCRVEDGTLTCSPEGRELRYWAIDDVPVWHAHHETLARAAARARDEALRGWRERPGETE